MPTTTRHPPEAYIQSLGHAGHFKDKHPATLITSSAAFEHSEKVGDWRELMRMYMALRTRSHIKNNYTEYNSERRRHCPTLDDDSRFLFPHRSVQTPEKFRPHFCAVHRKVHRAQRGLLKREKKSMPRCHPRPAGRSFNGYAARCSRHRWPMICRKTAANCRKY